MRITKAQLRRLIMEELGEEGPYGSLDWPEPDEATASEDDLSAMVRDSNLPDNEILWTVASALVVKNGDDIGYVLSNLRELTRSLEQEARAMREAP